MANNTSVNYIFEWHDKCASAGMSAPKAIQYESVLPDKALSPFVKRFWHLSAHTTESRIVTILPDGYFDILFFSDGKGFRKIYLAGLQTQPVDYIVPGNADTYAVSFRLPAAEYLLKQNLATLTNKGKFLTVQEWPTGAVAFSGFTDFTASMKKVFTPASSISIDPRKQELFSLLYKTAGDITVEALADKVHWSSRQISRYFTNWFGLSLKEYCNILRYRASFDHLSEGRLYPTQNYYDQAHFIKEIKKYSGVTPKELAQNKDDRFIQFSTLPHD